MLHVRSSSKTRYSPLRRKVNDGSRPPHRPFGRLHFRAEKIFPSDEPIGGEIPLKRIERGSGLDVELTERRGVSSGAHDRALVVDAVEQRRCQTVHRYATRLWLVAIGQNGGHLFSQ